MSDLCAVRAYHGIDEWRELWIIAEYKGLAFPLPHRGRDKFASNLDSLPALYPKFCPKYISEYLDDFIAVSVQENISLRHLEYVCLDYSGCIQFIGSLELGSHDNFRRHTSIEKSAPEDGSIKSADGEEFIND